MIVASSLPELLPPSARDKLIAEGLPAMQGIDEAVTAFAAAAWVGARRRRMTAAGATDALALWPVAAITAGRRVVSEWESKQGLAGFGLAVPDARLAGPDEAPAIAAALGFPVALKLAAPVLAHKTEAGAVRLGLTSDAEVAAAVAAMTRSLARLPSPVVVEQLLIERMAPKPVAELIVGVTRDPQFGLALVVGAGGVLVEMVQDAVTLLLPTDRPSIEQALARLKIAKLMAGYRGGPPADVAAAADAVMAIAAFAEAERHRLVELDVNPLFVLPVDDLAGGRERPGAIAVDALVVVADG
jgi:acyl-CoA synthetase (NDP forming)